MNGPRKQNIKRTHSLFIDNINIYQSNHEKLKAINKMIVKDSLDTSDCYGVKYCANIIFSRRKMVK